MISAQLKKYKLPEYKSSNNPKHNYLNYNSSHYPSYQTSNNHSQQGSYYPSPKSKIALLNQKIMKETQLFNNKRQKSINKSIARSQSSSRRRLRNQFYPTNPYIARFTDGQEIIRRKNVITKQRLASQEKERFNNMKKSLPPKSPLVLSQYFKNSTRSYEQQDSRKNISNNNRRGLQQIVFVTDQSQQQINSQYDNPSFQKTSPLHPTWRKGSDDFKQPLKEQLSSSFHNKYQYNIKDSNYLSIPDIQTPNFTSNILKTQNLSQKQILSPIQLQQQMITSRSPPFIVDEQTFASKPNFAKQLMKKSDKKAIFTSIFIITLIAILLFYEIIK